MTNYVAVATHYAQGVVAGVIPACRYVQQACKRQLDDLESPPAGYSFNEDRAARICTFVELTPHVKGPLASRGENIKLEPWQCFILTTVFGWLDSEGYRRFRRVYVEVPRGNGKALALDTLIPTPSGLREMGDINVGDFVMGSDGKPTRVTAATDVMHDRPCYEVEFNTGEVIVADAEHLWMTEAKSDEVSRGTGKSRIRRRPLTAKTTKQIAETINVNAKQERNHRVPICKGVDGTKGEFYVAPYALGAWLGDGHTDSAKITNQDAQVLERISSCGEPLHSKDQLHHSICAPGYMGRMDRLDNSFQARLRRLGVLGKKHIPNQYLVASFDQRMELLHGLMDTDGSCTLEQGQCEIGSKHELLGRQIYQLVCSLGYRARIMETRAKLNGKDCGPFWRIMFHAYSDHPPFSLKRKAERLRERPIKRSLQNYRQIVRVEPCDSVPVKCIEVDAQDHCYLASEGHILTHNSSFTSPIGLYMLALDGEAGAEVYSAATTRDQARIVFRDAQAMVRKMPQFRQRFGVEVPAQAITQMSSASTFKALSADGHTLDGLNIHFAGIDELHAHKTRDVYDVLETGLGKRPQSMLWVITTAGANKHGICYEVRDFTIKMLEGAVKDAASESSFGIIYTIDEGDDYFCEDTLKKANPNWGVSVDPTVVMQTMGKAKTVATARANYLTKHLNVWVDANTALFDTEKWRACEDKSLDEADFADCDSVTALDLASKIDIAAKLNVYRKQVDGKDHYYLFPRLFIPMAAIEEDRHPMYRGWEFQGDLVSTPGDTIDFSIIEDEIRLEAPSRNILAVVTDPWQSQHMLQNLQRDNLPAEEFRQTVANMSEATKSFDALMREGRLHHTGNAVMNWMVGNVVGHFDAKENVYPKKELQANKIDGAIAGIMALGWFLKSQDETEKDYQIFMI